MRHLLGGLQIWLLRGTGLTMLDEMARSLGSVLEVCFVYGHC
jgi:hypothetical protein